MVPASLLLKHSVEMILSKGEFKSKNRICLDKIFVTVRLKYLIVAVWNCSIIIYNS